MDIYDGEEWTGMDIEDLKAAIEHCHSIEEVAEFYAAPTPRMTSGTNGRN
jgi:hypothetical protein